MFYRGIINPRRAATIVECYDVGLDSCSMQKSPDLASPSAANMIRPSLGVELETLLLREFHMDDRDDKKMSPLDIVSFVVIGIALCAPALAEEQKKPPANQRFTLVCSTQMLRKTIAIDPAGRTVDGKPANFGEATITWKTGEVDASRKKGEKQGEPKNGVMHELNRLEGTYRSWNESEKAENSTTYGCEKAPPQRF
jgi:hypothetical protein